MRRLPAASPAKKRGKEEGKYAAPPAECFEGEEGEKGLSGPNEIATQRGARKKREKKKNQALQRPPCSKKKKKGTRARQTQVSPPLEEGEKGRKRPTLHLTLPFLLPPR